MGLTKTDIFTKHQNLIANQLKALAHPARIAIIEYLIKANSCICNDIVNEVQLAQPTISQHLKELKQAGLIKGSIEGKAICYCVDEQALKTLTTYLNTISKNLSTKNSCC